jgi:hypothetical protein
MREHDVHEPALDDRTAALPLDHREFLKATGCGVFIPGRRDPL